MSTPLVVTWAKKGELVAAPSPFSREATEPYMVLSRCKDATLLDVLFCEPCRVNLANVGQVEMHLEQGGTHRLVRYCSKHRVYEEADAPSSLQLGVGA